MPSFTENELETMLDVFESRMRKINEEYIKMIARNVKRVMNSNFGISSVSQERLIAMKQMGADINKINKMIAKEVGASLSDVDAILKRTAENEYKFYEGYYESSGMTQIPFSENESLKKILSAQALVTSKEMVNLSRTTVVSDSYVEAIDDAIQAVSSGVGDYGTAIRNVIRRSSKEGLKVQYASGLKRRLDTAARMNVLDGVRSISQEISFATGEEFGADGYEVSAHALCAEDHLHIQGKQYTKEQFQLVNDSLRRKIGKWNCGHFVYPIAFGISPPAYSDEEIKMFNEGSTRLVTIDGKTKTRYQWTQVQREIETRVREQKDIWIGAKELGDEKLKKECRRKIRELQAKYKHISSEADLEMRKDRMTVLGFGR